jgi:type III secretion system FlhB-like substrate exporter
METQANIAQYLDTTAFPATREEIIQMAEDNGAPDEVMELLGRIPDGVYETIHEVWALIYAG